MNEETLHKIQEKIYVLFREYCKVCQQEELRYFLLGGTMLGAVRHRGFIPWDDDIDVGMPREDYNKLLVLLSAETTINDLNTISLFRNNIEVYNASTSTKCSFDFTKLKKVAEIDGKEYDLFIDIFPLDGCPYESEMGIKLYYGMFNILRFMKNTHYMTLEGKNILKKTIVCLLRLKSLKSWNRIMNHYLLRHSFDTSKSVGNFSGHWGAKEIMKRDIYGVPTPVFFVDEEYMGVAKPDKYLTRMYGEYMKLPSKEERLSHFSD